MSMTNVWVVIRREYLQRVRSKWFIVSTVVAPIFLGALMVLPAYLAPRSKAADREIAVVDRTGVLYQELAPRLEEARYTVRQEPWSSDVVANLSQQVTDKKLGGFPRAGRGHAAHGGRGVLRTRAAVLAAGHRAAQRHRARGARAQPRGKRRGRQRRSSTAGTCTWTCFLRKGPGMGDPQFLVAYLGAFFLYFVILIYSVQVMRATLEEKTSRVVEVIISSMKPWHLMLGKILGVGAVGMTQMAVWALSAILLGSAGIPGDHRGAPGHGGPRGDPGRRFPGLGSGVLFLAFFVFGYFIFSALYAAVGAMCNTDEEAQQAQFPLMFLVIVPIVFVMQVIQDPTSTLAVTLSLIPFFTSHPDVRSGRGWGRARVADRGVLRPHGRHRGGGGLGGGAHLQGGDPHGGEAAHAARALEVGAGGVALLLVGTGGGCSPRGTPGLETLRLRHVGDCGLA